MIKIKLKIVELKKQKKIGKYKVNIVSCEVNGYSDYYRVEVKKGNKRLFLQEDNERYLAQCEDLFNEKCNEYYIANEEEQGHKCKNSYSELRPKTQESYIMQRVCKYCDKVMEEKAKITTFEGLVRAFVYNKLGKKTIVGKYKLSEDKSKLIYEGSGKNESFGQDILALRLKDGRAIGNASQLLRCGSYRRGVEAPTQRVMFDLNMAMIPFNVFEEANLDIQKAEVVEQGQEENFLLPKLVWDDYNAIMKPVNAKFEETSLEIPKTDDKKIILKYWEEEIRILDRYKNKRIKKDKNGDTIYKKTKGYRFEAIDKELLSNRHFIGAMLIRVNKRYFLFDVDRNELKHYGFNPFLSELPMPCKTIRQAYEMLKPKEVLQAEKKGLKVLRQGEWFFIPTKKKKFKIPKLPKHIKEGLDKTPESKKYDLDFVSNDEPIEIIEVKQGYQFRNLNPKYRKMMIERVRDYNKQAEKYQKFVRLKEEFESSYNNYEYGGELQAGNNRPNTTEKLVVLNGINYVKGWIKHTGREHEPINLEKWYIAIPNTAVKSFTITGNID